MGFNIKDVPILGQGAEFIENLLQGVGATENPYGDDIIRAMQDAQAKYEAYRPEHMQARMQGMHNAFSVFDPANKMLADMYGPGVGVNWQGAISNPFPQAPPPSEAQPTSPAPKANPDAIQEAMARTQNIVDPRYRSMNPGGTLDQRSPKQFYSSRGQ